MTRSTQVGSPSLVTQFEHDGLGRVTRKTDPENRVTTLQLDAFGRGISRNEPLGRTVSTNRDPMGRVTSEVVQGAGGTFTQRKTYDARGFERSQTDRAGAITTMDYDAAGQRTRMTDAEGRVSTYEYDRRGRLTRESLPGSGRIGIYTYDQVGNRITEDLPNLSRRVHTYDELNRRTQTHDALGTLETIAYDPMGRETQRTDADGNPTVYTRNDRGQVTLENRPGDRDINYTYTPHDEIETQTHANGLVLTHRYDDFGRRVETTDNAGTRSIEYDRVGNVLRETDRENRDVLHEYDALNRRERSKWPTLDLSESWTYDSLDRPITHTDKRGFLTTFALDGEGRIRQSTREGRIELQSYDRTGRRISSTDGLNRITRYFFDPAGRVEREEPPMERTLHWTYGPGDELLTETNAEGETSTYTYDARLRRETATNPAGETTTYEYNGRGLQTAMIRPNNALDAWRFEYDNAGRLESASDPEGNETVYEYDAADNLSAVIEPGAKRSEFQYDALSRRTLKKTADLPTGPPQIWSWTYDGEGNALLHTRPDGTLIEHQYDALNRVTSSTYSNAPAGSPSARAYQYDGNSNLTAISESNQGQTVSITTQYDAFDRPTQITDANSRIWTQAFDAADQRLSLASIGTPAVQWNYDPAGRPDQITVSGAGTYALSYDLADRNTRIEHPNGALTTHEFDQASRIKRIEHDRAGLSSAIYQYQYDDNGNRTQQIEENGAAPITTTFVYDKADRLTTISEPGKHTVYTLDGNSNRIQTTEGPNVGVITRRFVAEFDARNQLKEQLQYDSSNTLIATIAFDYDANGNLTSQIQGAAQTQWSYDALDRLIETTPPTGPPTQYRYGPGDVRIAKIRGGEEIRYQYDGERLILETNAIGNPQKHYAYTPAGLLNSQLLGANPENRSAHLDAQGSPIALTSSTGNILYRARYDAYGVETTLFGTRDHAISFQGYWTGTELEEIGKLLSAARVYIPRLGIFGERDPVEGIANEPASFNAYLIGRGNPHYWMDPDGRYGEAGHFYTSYIVTRRLGESHASALTFALYSQLPDEVGAFDAISQVPPAAFSAAGNALASQSAVPVRFGSKRDIHEIQCGVHALCGIDGDRATEIARALLIESPNLESAGVAGHLLADSFAHREMYGSNSTYDGPWGHARHMHRPDQIHQRPDMFGEYVEELAYAYGQLSGRSVNPENVSKIRVELLAAVDSALIEHSSSIKKWRADITGKNGRYNGMTLYWPPPTESQVGNHLYLGPSVDDLTVEAFARIATEAADGGVMLRPERYTPGVFDHEGAEAVNLRSFYESNGIVLSRPALRRKKEKLDAAVDDVLKRELEIVHGNW